MNAARALVLLLLLAPSAAAGAEIIRPDVIWHPTLSIDAGGDAHLACYFIDSYGQPGVGYSRRHAGVWTNELVAPEIVYSTSLALDPAGRPAVAYYTSSSRLFYADRQGGAWTSVQVDETSDQGGTISLAFDAQGRPHIAYPWHETLKHAWRDGATWSTEVIDAALGADTYPGTSIGVDALGRLGVSYHRGSTLVFARRAASGWNLQTVPGATAYVGTSLTFDPSGLARFTYENSSGLYLATETGSGWTTELIEAGAGTASLARDGSQVAFYENGCAIYARRVGGQWQKQVIDDRFRSGQEIAVALAPDGHAEIAYTFKGYTGGDLRYAVVSGPVGVEDPAKATSLSFAPPTPNPGRVAALTFELPRAVSVSFAAYDASGRLAATRAAAAFEAGRNSVRWEPSVRAGTYFVRLTTSTGESAVVRWTKL